MGRDDWDSENVSCRAGRLNEQYHRRTAHWWKREIMSFPAMCDTAGADAKQFRMSLYISKVLYRTIDSRCAPLLPGARWKLESVIRFSTPPSSKMLWDTFGPFSYIFRTRVIQLFVCARPTLACRIGLDVKPPIEPKFADSRLVLPASMGLPFSDHAVSAGTRSSMERAARRCMQHFSSCMGPEGVPDKM